MSHLTVTVVDGRGRAASSPLARWLSGAAPAMARGAVTIALISDPAMRRLNRDHRSVDAPTDVLSFPVTGPGPSEVGSTAEGRSGAPKLLGDIAIATGVARRQARERRHSLATELRILALHGLLHLLGYDHATDRGEMRRLEERLRRRAGLPLGLISRTGRPGPSAGRS